MRLSLPAPAKLNLFLHITGRREDGYHNLQTLFQLLDYSDVLDFELNDSGKICLTDEQTGIPVTENLIYQAARRLQEHTGCQLGANIHLQKRLPMGGGLGGGSSNAATTLTGLNILWGTALPQRQLMAIGGELGADIPLFIFGHSAWGEGIGEQLTAIELPPAWYLVITPEAHVSTGKIFAHQGLTRNTHPIKIRAFLERGDRNDCQAVVESLYPQIKEARLWLAQFTEARLTGTGACLFGCFDSNTTAKSVLEQLPHRWQGFVAKGVNRSPLLQQLPSKY